MPQIRQSITDHVLFTQARAPIVQAASTVTESARYDMVDYDFIDFILDVGVNTNNTVDAKVQENTASAGGVSTDVAGAAIVQIAAGAGPTKVVISVKRETMTKRYASLLVTTGAGVSGAAVAVVAVRYRKVGYEPVVQEALTTQVIKV